MLLLALGAAAAVLRWLALRRGVFLVVLRRCSIDRHLSTGSIPRLIHLRELSCSIEVWRPRRCRLLLFLHHLKFHFAIQPLDKALVHGKCTVELGIHLLEGSG